MTLPIDREKQGFQVATESRELPIFTRYTLQYPKGPKHPIVTTSNTILDGLYSVAAAAYTLSTRDDISHKQQLDTINKITRLMDALNHLGHISYVQAGGNPEDIEGWDETKRYIKHLPKERFPVEQHKRFQVAQEHAGSTQRMYANTSAHVLTDYIRGLRNDIASITSGINLPFKDRTVVIDSEEELEVRGKLFPIITHDVRGVLTPTQVVIQLAEKAAERLEVAGIWPTDEQQFQTLRHRYDEKKNAGLGLWRDTVYGEVTKLAVLMNEPYRSQIMTTKRLEEVLKEEAVMQKDLKGLNISVKSFGQNGNFIWSREWISVLVKNIAQNTLRARGGRSGAELGISIHVVDGNVVIAFSDNGPGFKKDILQNGRIVGHGYVDEVSNSESTGTAWHAITTMLQRYGGDYVAVNKYVFPASTRRGRDEIEESPNYRGGSDVQCIGASTKIIIPLIKEKKV